MFEITYTATATAEDITIVRDVRAGVSGPCGTVDLPEGKEFDLDALTDALKASGYTVTSPWRVVRSYEGLWLEADVLPA